MIDDKNIKKIVIVGGGFAGLSAARALGHLPVAVTLIDRRNHHTFQPLLYQIATATLSPSDIAQPIRSIVRDYKNIEVVMDQVTGFDSEHSTVLTESGLNLKYEYLIIATGATHSYFGNDQWATFAPGLKTIEDAIEIRGKILSAFEQAERQMVDKGSHDPINFVVIGAGPTGVELAGAIADTCRIYLCKDFHMIKTCDARVILIEAAGRVLMPYPEDLAAKAARQLEELGVEILVNTKVTDVRAGEVITDKGVYPSATTVWAAGVRASSLGKALADSFSLELDKRGCVVVDDYLNPGGHRNIFVIGDIAHKMQNGAPLPGVAQSALQMGAFAAETIARDLRGSDRKAFIYQDRGDMATIGRAKAIANIKWPFKAQLSGVPAWASWLIIHIFFLIGLRNRLFVFLSWLWTFFSQRRAAQLITGSDQNATATKDLAPKVAATAGTGNANPTYLDPLG